jgi:hypothetical protein
VRATLALHQLLQALRARDVRRRFDAEERAVLAADLTARRPAGRLAVVRQWPVIVRDGLADALSTRRVSPRDTLRRRAVDLVVVGAVGPPVLLVTGVLALLVRATSGGPAFVEVGYVGRGGRRLVLRKLRTLTAGGAVTPAGRLLRRTRLDELPTLLALARGDVTLVGPRPSRDPAATPPEVRPGLIWPA